MLNYYEELTLNAFFASEALTNRCFEDKDEMLDVFSEIFLLSESSTSGIKKLISERDVSEIESVNDYLMYCRMKQYLDKDSFVDDTDAVISLKGNVLLTLNEARLIKNTSAGRSEVCNHLIEAANMGNITANFIVGVLQSEGILFEKDAKKGLERIEKIADWNSIDGLFAALYYGSKNKTYYSRLYDGFCNLGRKNLFVRVSEVYGRNNVVELEESRLIEKAFNQGKIKRDTYQNGYSRLLNTKILSKKDKAALLLSENKELLEEAYALPLELSDDKVPAFDANIFKDKFFMAEYGEVAERYIQRSRIRNTGNNKPLCIVCNDKLILDAFSEAMAESLTNAVTERIEVGDLSDSDFEPTRNNIFVRNCNEDNLNFYFLFFNGDIAGRHFDLAKAFLQSKNRAHFRLNRPCVTLNLSSILPICFADKMNAAMLGKYCEILTVKEPSREDKLRFIQKFSDSQSAEYIKALSPSVIQKLTEYGIEDIENILIDAAYRCQGAGKENALNDETMLRVMAKPNKTYGFGGFINENK